MDTLTSEYLASIQRRDLSPGTVAHRRWLLDGFSAHLHPRTLLDATGADIEAFIARPIAARTRCCYLSHFSAFYVWCIDRGLCEHDPTDRLERPKLRQPLPRPISDADLAVALGCGDRMYEAWFWLASHAGLRCAEIATLDAPDVDPAGMTLRVLGKGRKERVVPMHPSVLLALQAHGLRRTGPVFRRACGGHWTARQVSRRGNEVLMSLGSRATMHQLRHWFGTRTLDACGDLRAVQELLGHASPSTTAIYTKVAVTRLRSAVDALSVGRDRVAVGAGS